MGLGPPVCIACDRLMQLQPATGTPSEGYRCLACGKDGQATTGVTHLLCLSPEHAEKLLEKAIRLHPLREERLSELARRFPPPQEWYEREEPEPLF